MPILNRFLCFDTRRGSVACGIYTASQSLTLMLLDIVLLAYMDVVYRNLRRAMPTYDLTYQGLQNAIIVSMLLSLLFFISCISLIIGVAKRMRTLTYPWLAFLITYISMTLILGLFVLGNLYTEMGDVMWGGIVGIILVNIFHVYCVLCVISYHQLLTEGEPKKLPS